MQRQFSVKEAEKAYKKTHQSPFVKYCITVVAGLLLAGTVFTCLLFNTDFLYSINTSSLRISTSSPSTTAITSTVEVVKNSSVIQDTSQSLLAGVTSSQFDVQGNVQLNSSGTGTGAIYAPGSAMGGGTLIEAVDGWLNIYDGPTVSGDYFSVPIPESYRANSWAMGEGASSTGSIYCRNTYSVSDGNDLVSLPTNGKVNNNGRYWVAVGPAVTNPDFVCVTGSSASVTPTDMKLPKLIDVVLVDKETGDVVYVPCVIGDVKAHTAPTGIVQTGVHVKSGVLASGHDDSSVIEFVGVAPSVATALHSKYEIKEIYVYK